MIEKMINKAVDRLTNGNEKDKRIKELWDALNHVVATVKTYGYMDLYEANPEWQPPVYLRDGEYTTEKRLKDIRRHSIEIRKASHEAEGVLLKMGQWDDIPYNY